MLLAYLDESHSDKAYFIAALIVPGDEAMALAADLDAVVEQACATYENLSPSAELHGYDLFHGKRDWAGLKSMLRARIGVYEASLAAIAKGGARIIVRAVDVPGLVRRYSQGHKHPHRVVLEHLTERIDEFAEAADEFVLMIADEVEGEVTHRRDLWGHQRVGTSGYRKRKICRVVDTLHFAPSAASRLLQAADLVAYLAHRRSSPERDSRVEQVNTRLWQVIQPVVHHQHAWFP